MIASAVTRLARARLPHHCDASRPAASENDTPSTARTEGRRRVNSTRRSSTSSSAVTRAYRTARVERVAQAVADEVDREHGEEDRQPREHGEPPVRARRCAIESVSRLPQLGVGGWMPKPRNDSVLSMRIASATTSVAFTMIGPSAVREHVPHDDPRVRRADRTRGVDELPLAQRQRRAAHHRAIDPQSSNDSSSVMPKRAAEIERAEGAEIDGADRHRDREERERGERDPEVGEPHQQAVEPAAVEAGERRRSPRRSASRGSRSRRDLERDLPTMQHTRQRVAVPRSVPNQCDHDGPDVVACGSGGGDRWGSARSGRARSTRRT